MISKTDWKLNLFVPINKHKSEFVKKVKKNIYINLNYFENSPIIGGNIFLNNFIYKYNLANPLYQNVLVAAIFQAIKFGYKKIIIYTEDPHFYKNPNQKSIILRNPQGEPLRIFEFFQTQSRLSKIYLSLNSFSKTKNCEILNLSEKTWIDAFKRN